MTQQIQVSGYTMGTTCPGDRKAGGTFEDETGAKMETGTDGRGIFQWHIARKPGWALRPFPCSSLEVADGRMQEGF